MGEYIVATALKTRLPLIQSKIEELVQRRSRIESNGNAVFTLMLLQRFESKEEITEDFVSQSAITACMRSVCIRDQNELPEDVKFRVDADVQVCMRDAQKVVIQLMKSFDPDEGLGQIVNDAARRYLTVFKNNFSEHMDKWQRRTILADLRCRKHHALTDKKLLSFIVDSIIHMTSHGTPLDTSKRRIESIRQ